MTTTYRVVWEIDVEADSSREAAEKALAIQRDRKSAATVFEVRWRTEEPGEEIVHTSLIDLPSEVD